MTERAKSGLYWPHDRVLTPVGTVSMTRQEFAEECDINVLMARYEKVGQLPQNLNGQVPQYLDLCDVPDFQEAFELVADASRAFMSLPAGVRAEFGNNPAEFVTFAENPANIEQMRAWNLAPPAPVVPEPVTAPVISPSTAI
ncbi:internal scaffolding protein [Blackfly microvirus SF02]|uniref:Internal scaffolding protein n=1 Tax=Blackfly microvirus SF02 TaxID=2576452 RepID=A0A4P8PSJ9_9VIRU|nr:internal scaffolding protein [Blackfly microvirus SF02]